jgi:uncharacterized membrane protein
MRATVDTPAHEPGRFTISRNRLEFLFDGIFAIAMTILVLELKVPELADGRSFAEMGRALAHDAPTFGSYLLSFLMLGVMWYRHNQMYRHLRFVTNGMFALHLIMLAMAAFFPFCAALLGRYPTNPFSSAIYLGCLGVYLWGALLAWIVARRVGAIEERFGLPDYFRYRRRAVVGCFAVTLLFVLRLAALLGA